MSLIGRTEGFSSFSCPTMLDFYIQSHLYIKSVLEIVKYDTKSFRWRIGTSSDVCEFKIYSDFLFYPCLFLGGTTPSTFSMHARVDNLHCLISFVLGFFAEKDHPPETNQSLLYKEMPVGSEPLQRFMNRSYDRMLHPSGGI
jgi:hypothetical protein